MSAICTACASCLAWIPSSVLVLGVSASRNGQIEPPAYPKYVWNPATSNHSAMASTTRTAAALRLDRGTATKLCAMNFCNKFRCCQRPRALRAFPVELQLVACVGAYRCIVVAAVRGREEGGEAV